MPASKLARLKITAANTRKHLPQVTAFRESQRAIKAALKEAEAFEDSRATDAVIALLQGTTDILADAAGYLRDARVALNKLVVASKLPR